MHRSVESLLGSACRACITFHDCAIDTNAASQALLAGEQAQQRVVWIAQHDISDVSTQISANKC